ncbi:Hypothetical protein GLP15_2886 [Giardia lamblia P15]|uniref:Uncharacterized protein n=1 Tax=Giardia intestinalis (strain P15) TaxID=658858 RepID=E1F8Z6_GIAIA|nr:Hypothetical protein GLP15_2886 [Giardia lamblia P15]
MRAPASKEYKSIAFNAATNTTGSMRLGIDTSVTHYAELAPIGVNDVLHKKTRRRRGLTPTPRGIARSPVVEPAPSGLGCVTGSTAPEAGPPGPTRARVACLQAQAAAARGWAREGGVSGGRHEEPSAAQGERAAWGFLPSGAGWHPNLESWAPDLGAASERGPPAPWEEGSYKHTSYSEIANKPTCSSAPPGARPPLSEPASRGPGCPSRDPWGRVVDPSRPASAGAAGDRASSADCRFSAAFFIAPEEAQALPPEPAGVWPWMPDVSVAARATDSPGQQLATGRRRNRVNLII